MILALQIWLLGTLFGVVLFFLTGAATLQSILSILPSPVVEGTFGIFLKNSLASLTTIYLGLVLCLVELRIYEGVSRETYAFLEGLTSPLYRFLGWLDRRFQELRPFYRSCYFYLAFVPSLSLFVNGMVLGLLLQLDFRSLYPHAIFEIPAILASAIIGFSILGELKAPIESGSLYRLKKEMQKAFKDKVSLVIVIQIVLLVAAILESS
ncbi:MAG: stage II sporulation protein M [Candidatus Hydrothermarchaeales archaeon]